MKLSIICALVVVGLGGCVSQSYKDNLNDATSVNEEMNNLKSDSFQNIVYINKPPVDFSPIPVKKTGWVSNKVEVDLVDVPLTDAINVILQDSDVSVFFNEVDPLVRVSLKARTTRENVIKLLENKTGYSFLVSENSISVQSYLSETFVINLPIGNVSSQQGTQGESTGENSDLKVEGQFISVSYEEQNVFDEITKAVEAILKDDNKMIGTVQSVPSMAGITVRTTPLRMKQAREVIEHYQAELSKQVQLDVTVLEFRSRLGNDQGIDWNILKEVSDGTLNFVASGTTALASGNPAGLAFVGSGKWDGTTAFIRALEEQGTVSTQTPIFIRTVSSQPARISQTLETPYLSDISTQITETSTSTSTTRDKVVEGVDMMVSANVKKNHVWLRIAGKLTKIAGDSSEKIGDAQLRFIQTRSAELNFTNKLKYGQTVVIGSIKQENKSANRASSFGIKALGSQSAVSETVETLVLLTPRKS